MSKTIIFIKRYWLLLFLGVIAISLLIIRLTYRKPSEITPEVPIQKQTLNPPTINGFSLPKQIEFNYSEFPQTTELKIFQGKTAAISEEQANKIARVFNFSSSPQITDDVIEGKYLIWSNNTNYLSIALKTGEVDYGLNLYQANFAKIGTLPTSTQAREKLENLMDKIGLKSTAQIKWQEDKYLTGGVYFNPVDNPQKADFIRVGFNFDLNSYQLVGYDPQEPLVFLILDKNKEIARFQVNNYFVSFEEKDIYDLKPETEVKSELLSQGTIVYLSNQPVSGEPPNIIKVIFNQISLAYFQEANLNPLIQPIYILSGQGTLADGSQTEVVAYLPAIASKWLKTPQKHFEIQNFNLPTGGFSF